MTWIDEAARYLAREPESVARALARHAPEPSGRCAACGVSINWPCAVAISAERARSLLDAGQVVRAAPASRIRRQTAIRRRIRTADLLETHAQGDVHR